MAKVLTVRRWDSGKVVKIIELSNQCERYIDRVERGLNINLNHEQFYTDVLEEETAKSLQERKEGDGDASEG